MAALLSYRINPHDILALHAELPVQHEFFRAHVNERLSVAQLSSRNLSRKHFSLWNRKDALIITIQNMNMRSVVATVLFRIHVQNHTQKCRYTSHKFFLS